jgi:outer membrane protein TolC
MSKNAPTARCWITRVLPSLTLSAVATLAGHAYAEDQQPVAVAPAATVTVPAYTVADCVRIAREQQPALAAQRASVTAAQTQSTALQKLRVPTFVSRDLPIRRKQACIGITIAQAGLDQAELETDYAVIRTYYGVLYARQQQMVAQELCKKLQFYHDQVEGLVNGVLQGSSREFDKNSVAKIKVYLRTAETRQAEATRGIDRATSALREAMGLDAQCPLVLAETQLPEPKVQVTKEQIVALALAQRGEISQVNAALEVVHLEVCAQGKSFMPTARTFAAGVDVHSRPVPQGLSNGEYRPGATSLEMPTMFAGSRSYRVERACDLGVRAEAVVQKTRNLVSLEAEDAFFKYEEALHQMPQFGDADKSATILVESIREAFNSENKGKVKIDDILNSEGLAAQTRASLNETRYHLIVALAGLQRVTGGGFDPCIIPAN